MAVGFRCRKLKGIQCMQYMYQRSVVCGRCSAAFRVAHRASSLLVTSIVIDVMVVVGVVISSFAGISIVDELGHFGDVFGTSLYALRCLVVVLVVTPVAPCVRVGGRGRACADDVQVVDEDEQQGDDEEDRKFHNSECKIKNVKKI